MLLIAKSIHQLMFSELMCVYEDENILNAKKHYPNLTGNEGLNCIEQDFYHYLNSVFFRQEDSFYAIWEENGKYLSAFRLEPYDDGLLLCGLHTKSDGRGRGIACQLITAVCSLLAKSGRGIIYSHVAKNNHASLAVHKNCGFRIIKDHAFFSDNSISYDSYTLSIEY